MSYTPTTWVNGDTITAEKMNKIEGGIANASAGAGVQLYGPYTAAVTYTVDGLASEVVECHTVEDENGISVVYPDVSTGAKVFVYSAKTDKGFLQAFKGPSIATMGPLGTVWIDGSVTVYNNSESSAEIEVLLNFYSTVEFPQES